MFGIKGGIAFITPFKLPGPFWWRNLKCREFFMPPYKIFIW